MRFKVNIRARLERHARNSHVFQKSGVYRIMRRFRILSVLVVLVLPIYPSFGAFGLGDETTVGEYDNSTIITAYEDETSESMFSQDSGFIKPGVVLNDVRDLDGANRLLSYKVESGDSLSVIAEKFDVSVDSVVWANDFNENSMLKPGQVIKIPPVTGVVHTVAKGETVDALATKYKIASEKIRKQNALAASQDLLIGQTLVIPGAVRAKAVAVKKEAPKPKLTAKSHPKSLLSTPEKAAGRAYSVKFTGKGKGFVWGNCTYYVANNKNVTWRGNANQWLRNAAAAGVPTGKTPANGAIVSLSGRGYNPYYGHVGIVVDVDGNDIIVKDMNYRRLNEVTIRRIPKTDPTIRGYIYSD